MWPPLWLSVETLLARGHLSRWAQLQARVSGTFRSGLLHWLTTMECPGLVLPRFFLLLSPRWLTTMGHTHVFPLLGEFDLSHPFANAGLLSVLDDGYGILTAEYRLWRDQCGGAASPRLRALLRRE